MMSKVFSSHTVKSPFYVMVKMRLETMSIPTDFGVSWSVDLNQLFTFKLLMSDNLYILESSEMATSWIEPDLMPTMILL